MNRSTLAKAKSEAERFLRQVRALEAHADFKDSDPAFIPSLPRQTGFVRRASMDLTRALADLRTAN